jgi:hypothetical protein
MHRIDLLAIVCSIALLLVILEMVRRRALSERYSLLWLLTGAVLLLLSCWRAALDKVARLVGIYYSPSALMLIGIGFILLILLHFSMVISKLADQQKELAQRHAILAWQIKEMARRGQNGPQIPQRRDYPAQGLANGDHSVAS